MTVLVRRAALFLLATIAGCSASIEEDLAEELVDAAVASPDATGLNGTREDDVCVPKTCNDDECGLVPNGCNGTLDCGACNTCSEDVGTACVAQMREKRPGCDDEYGCAAFWGVYYDSSGCSPELANSYVEYDGPACTYVGFASYDPFKNTPDGTCIDSSARGYSGKNTFTRVVPGTGCTYLALVDKPGTVECDGTCKPNAAP